MRKWTVKIQEQDKQRDLPWSVWVPSLYEFACNLSHPSFLWVMQQVQPLWSPKNSKGKGMISRESLQWLLSHVTLGLQVEGCPGALCLEPVFPDWQASNLAPTLSNSWAGRKLQKMLQAFPLLKVLMRAFFMVQWLRIHLPMQGTWFDPCSRIPHALGQVSLSATTTESLFLEPMLHNKRNNEKPERCN